MNTEYLKYILEIASCQSINRAAENLSFQRQYLSKVLHNVERQFGINIFTRNSKGVELTDEGLYFVTQAEKIVNMMDELENHCHQSTAVYREFKEPITFYLPDLSFSHPTAYGVVEIFKKQFPNVKLHLKPKTRSEIIDSLKEQPDIPGMYFSPKPDESIALENVTVQRLKQVPLVAVASADNPIAKRYRIMSLELLMQQDLVSIEGEEERTQMILPPKYKKLLQEKVKYYVGSANALRSILKQQHCFSLTLHNEDLSGEGLLQIPLEDPINVSVYLVYHKKALQYFPTKTFLNEILSYYQVPVIL